MIFLILLNILTATLATDTISSSKFSRSSCPKALGPHLRFNDSILPFSYPLLSCPLQSAFTCCEYEHDKKLQSLYLTCMDNQLTSPCCQSLVQLSCYSCDGNIALGGKKYGLCSNEVCPILYDSCKNDYFTIDDSTNRLIPCTSDTLLCMKLTSIIHYLPSSDKNEYNNNNDPNTLLDKDSITEGSSASILPKSTLYSLCSMFGYPLSSSFSSNSNTCYTLDEKLEVPNDYKFPIEKKVRKVIRDRSSAPTDYYDDEHISTYFPWLFSSQNNRITLLITFIVIGLVTIGWKRRKVSLSNYAYSNTTNGGEGQVLFTTSTSSSSLTIEQLREQRLQYFNNNNSTATNTINQTTKVSSVIDNNLSSSISELSSNRNE